MEFTFNLKDAQIYIPSGRIMNLKKKLGWDDVELTQSDISNIKSHLVAQDYSNEDIQEKTNKVIKELMTYQERKEARQRAYIRVGRESVIRPELFTEVKHELMEDCKEQIPEILESLRNLPEIQKKFQKLEVLKQAQDMLISKPNKMKP